MIANPHGLPGTPARPGAAADARAPRTGLWLASAVVAVMIGLSLAPEVAAALRYERAAVLQGELWRLLSGQLVHAGARHLLLNVAGLGLLLAVFGPLATWRAWTLAALAGALAVGTGLVWLQPRLEWYVGASGWVFGLVAAAAGFAAARRRGLEAGAALALLCLRGVLDASGSAGLSPGELAGIGVPVIGVAHWYGAMGGGLAGLAVLWRSRRL